MDRASFKAALESAGYTEITTTTTPQERHNPEHAHKYDVRGMVLDGSLTLTWDGQTKTFRPGDIYTMPRDCRHSESLGLDGASTLSGRKY
jgi:quercetin dioxygenase-like cupin family protein